MFMKGIEPYEQVMIYSVLGMAVVALLYAYWLARKTFAADTGTPEMQRIWGYIRDGANTYLRTQMKTISILIVVLTIAMFLSVALVPPTGEANELFCAEAVETALANEIAANTSLSAAQAIQLLETKTAQLIAHENGYTALRPDRIAASVACQQAVWGIAFARALAFVMGATFSATVGFIGMNMAVQGNVRVASASRRSFKEALTIAYRSGTITGMLTDGLGLLGGTFIFILFVKASPDVLLGFGFGATLIALFMRVGGGIYTKAADVGADLVGKVEADMDEDDPRNAAVIADLVGDNVGDCAGMAADIFESYEVTIVASLILGLALSAMTGQLFWIILPLLVRGIGVLSSIFGTYAVSLWDVDDAEEAMFKSYELSSAITITATFLLSVLYAGRVDPSPNPAIGTLSHLSLGALVAVGVGLAVAFNPLTAKATSANSPRVQKIAKATHFGPALVILEGMSLGYLSSVWSVLVIAAALMAAVVVYTLIFPVALYSWAIGIGLLIAIGFIVRGVMRKEIVNGFFFAMWTMVAALFLVSMQGEALATDGRITYILFGVSLIGVGMLSHTGNNVSMDTFGPISDNANGIGELAYDDFTPESRQIMADLDAAGNTTKAITKGVAIGSAVIAALSLFGAFFTDIERVMPEARIASFERVINLADPTVFIGLLLGGAIPLLFGGLLIKAVNRAAGQIMTEVRRQLRIPAIWNKEETPDYTRAVGISTKAAQTELIPLGLIAILSPIVVGLILKEQGLGGFLAGVIMAGLLQAVFMANSGGAWDNAKKYIEDGNFGGKNSENHKAAVVGDIVGDPLKDTAGPALNPMIKVINLVALIVAPIVVRYTNMTWGIFIFLVVCIGLILWAVKRSDREDNTIDDAMEEKPITVPSGD